MLTAKANGRALNILVCIGDIFENICSHALAMRVIVLLLCRGFSFFLFLKVKVNVSCETFN